MYGRATILFPLAVLTLLAALTLWIDRVVKEPEHKADASHRHDPDYFLDNFVTSRTDVNGNLRYMLAAVEMKHYPDDDSTKLQRPRFTQYTTDKPYTQIESQHGLVSSNGEKIEFMDNVKVVRQAFQDRGEMTVLTEYLKVFPKEDLATTDQPVVIMQAPKTVIHATGMVFDKKEKTLKLLSKVHVHYEKPGLPQKAGAATASTSKKQASETNQSQPSQKDTRIRRTYERPTPP
jgi:lipopolysaccharide export system protein LptC